MKKMKGWTLLMCLFSAAFSIPLPHAHPGYINFSYEVMTPLKWYQNLMGHQYPRLSYEPMGWMHHHSAMPHHGSYGFQQIHAMSHPMHPSQQHLQPSLNSHMHPAGHGPFGQMPGPNTIPHYQAGGQAQHPLSPNAAENTGHHQPGNPNHPIQPGHPNQPMYPVHPLPPLPPVIHDGPVEPWPGTDKTKQEEVD